MEFSFLVKVMLEVIYDPFVFELIEAYAHVLSEATWHQWLPLILSRETQPLQAHEYKTRVEYCLLVSVLCAPQLTKA